ncbi:hypothetical protein [Caldivirga maquilingensis]|uniref:DsrE family protein n=1 Tax=Caldivirga maquilingensis (strain ATCC 700844 / DSM 13496 / JCM 10307 / IC-167) TaxID=397948 RepID=A8M987_CALMQ|nr:hypothetical protein [Caldivirga maquilingensis]ABW02306.1 conserved hypothetical protein [Caldivirga maquilingensis IC-167]
MAKILFIVMGDPSNLVDSIRAAHAFHYAVELKKAGNDVYVYLDGPGVKIPVTESPYKGLRPAYERALMENVILGACGYCASPPHLNVRDKLPRSIRLIGDEEHHYALTDLVSQGFQITIV